jgi:hypothetical protein
MVGSVRFGIVAALLGVAVGCSREPAFPKTYPTTGKVVYRDGRPMEGGSLQLTTASDPLLRVVGEIKNDGTFTLRTVKENAHGGGVPLGEYKILVQPPALESGGGVQGKSQPAISLPDTFKVEAKENTFHIVLPEP